MIDKLKTIKTYIADNELKLAFKEAMVLLEGHSKESNIVNLQSQFRQIEEQFDLSLIGIEEYKIIKNRIISGFFNTINNVISSEEKKDESQPKNSKQSLKKILQLLDLAYDGFLTQIKVRDKLVESIYNRTKDIPKGQFWEYFLNHYDLGLSASEKILHQRIRGWTSDVIAMYNFKTIAILNDNEQLFDIIPELRNLSIHLNYWKSQHDNEFINNEGISLVYLREMDKGFPSGIEKIIEEKITTM